jgi:carbonic anhydrase
MQKLVDGIHHFQANIFREQAELFRRLADKGQNPQALLITCCDSRILPHQITQAEPGDLFILRTLGNVIPPHGASNGGEGATVEYALTALGIKDVIVCGHSHCGAMQALLQPEKLAAVPKVRQWLAHAEATKLIMQEKYPHLTDNALLTATVEENVLVQLENLRTHPVVAAGLAKGDLKLHAWVFKIETGQVFRFDPVQGQFLPLTESPDSGELPPATYQIYGPPAAAG